MADGRWQNGQGYDRGKCFYGFAVSGEGRGVGDGARAALHVAGGGAEPGSVAGGGGGADQGGTGEVVGGAVGGDGIWNFREGELGGNRKGKCT